ncbi:hypothetical protein HDV06_000991 [Boothiomyces sp. JEL0866]|nr:hypothetical protein HDV06_000991 [Boothiomyces sp. JEL0866]
MAEHKPHPNIPLNPIRIAKITAVFYGIIYGYIFGPSLQVGKIHFMKWYRNEKSKAKLNINFGSTSFKTKLDVYPMNSRDNPVIVFFYGGSWNSGSKRLYSPIAENFHKRGYVVVMPDYTLWPEGKSDTILEDIQRAIEWTIKNISEYGGSPSNIFVFGHSAGAHSVCLSFVNHAIEMMKGPTELHLHKVKGLFLLNGPYDIAEHFKWESKRGVEELSCMERLFRPMDNYSPTLLLQKNNVNPSYLPQNWILIHTKGDGVVPYESSSRLYDELERTGVRHLRLLGDDVEEHAKEIFEMFLNVSETFDSIDRIIRQCDDIYPITTK